MNSRIPGFFRLSQADRLKAVGHSSGLTSSELQAFCEPPSPAVVESMIENVIGSFVLPCGVAVNLRLNQEDRLVPMVIEEPSVVAAVSNMARLTREAGGVFASVDPSVMIGQIQITGVADPNQAARTLQAHFEELEQMCAGVHAQLELLGGGLRGFEVRTLCYDEPGYPPENMLVLHLFLDCKDAMGANMVNTLAELLAPRVAQLTGGTPGLRILSNLADRRLARAETRIPVELLSQEDGNGESVSGKEVAARIASAWRFAWADPYRAVTHNKGIMNGIDAVALATGNDWRAIEAGAHAYAARGGQYRPLSSWRLEGDVLTGKIELPMQVGTVGGPIKVHPTVQANHKLAGIKNAGDLAGLMAAVGLIQNLGALRALAMEGIQEGHMRMHARTVALGAGAGVEEIPCVVEELVRKKLFTVDAAKSALASLRAR
jgi:hydroxymethylglutaryl-CoA reductase